MSSVVARALVIAGVAAAAALIPGPAAHAVDGTVTQVAASPPGGTSGRADVSMSDNGRYFAFQSYEVTPGDTNGVPDVFLLDATTGSTILVSRTAAGSAGNGPSIHPEVSANGKFVVFASSATDLTADSAGSTDTQVFRYNIATGKNMRISKSPRGELAKGMAADPSISSTGRYISYMSYGHNVVPGDHNGVADVFRYDAELNQTIKVSETLSGAETDRNSSNAVISPDGRYVAYATGAQNMGPVDTNGQVDTYVYDVQTDTTTLASRGVSGVAAGKTAPTDISNGGTVVALNSYSPRLAPADTDKETDVFVYRSRTDSVALVNAAGTDAYQAHLSADGRWVFYDSRSSGTTSGPATMILMDRNTNERTDLVAPRNGSVGWLSTTAARAAFFAADPATPTQVELYLWTRAG